MRIAFINFLILSDIKCLIDRKVLGYFIKNIVLGHGLFVYNII